MGLLIMIKNLTSVYDSPNVAYYCGNTYPWFYSDGLGNEQFNNTPLVCLEKPQTCSLENYYKDSYSFTYNNDMHTIYSQYGYVDSGASGGQSDNPLYAFTIADKSYVYNYGLDNPSQSLCYMLYRISAARRPAILVVAPVVSGDTELTSQSQALWQFIIDECIAETGMDYSNRVIYFDSQSSLEDYVSDRHYEDEDYGYGKVAFSIVLNAADPAAAQWDYSVRTNYTSIWYQDDHTVACLYGGYKGCDFTFTIPSTKFYTQDLFKPQSAEFLYGYTYSGFATLQQAVDQFIFLQQTSVLSGTDSEHRRVLSTPPTAANQGEHSPQPAPPTEADAADITGSYTSMLPGVVRIMASVGLMPTQAYKTDDFQYVISSTLGIFYMLSFLYPVSRIIRALVLEKETRIKEGKCAL